jgi:demethylmenaquinone methyltransferase/2-methoxy-6-polyprenyl-1,4-benzoquinol methylase
MKDPDRTVDASAHAPHPVLPQYYGRPEDRRDFVRQIFDRTAGDYDRVERVAALGSGSRYRRLALLRAGLKPGMRVLDVAAGTGLVTREALAIVGDSSNVTGLDPSGAMMRSGLQALQVALVQGTAERLPFADGHFDFVSMGFALRHVADLPAVFREFRRVLRPDGIVCVLEITPPENAFSRRLLKLYLGSIVPFASRLLARHAETPMLFRYFWDTIEACVPPAQVLEAMQSANLDRARRHVEARVFSEYTARR